MPHNGGRSQINLALPQTDGAFPFINHLKAAQHWVLGDSSGVPSPDTLSAAGYPISISNEGVYTVFYIPTASQRPGNWRLRWTGTGTVTAGGGGGSATNGSYTFEPAQNPQLGSNRIVLQIASGTNISSVEFFHADDEALLDAGNIFNTKFLDTLRYGNWGVLRFIGWQGYTDVNVTNVSQWSHRKPLGYAYWCGGEYRASIYAGATTNSGDAYSCSASPGWAGLVDKATVSVRFNASSTDVTPTLNVGGTGAKTIRDPSGTELHANLKPASGRIGTLVFDADLDVWLLFGGDGAQHFDVVLNNGVPVEVMLALCEEVGAHPWFIRPYLSCDPITDWMTGLSTYVRDNAPSWMVPRYEVVPNETWNSANGFYATRYAWLKAKVHWPATSTSNDHDWVGQVASTGGQAVSAVYSDNRSRYQAIVGVQAHGSTSPTARLASTLYVANNAGSAAYNWVTHIAPANYITDTYTSLQRTAAATAYDEADTAGKLVIATAYVNSTLVDSGGDQYQFSIPRLIDTILPAFKTWAEGYGVGLTFYEGGWSPDYTGDAELDALKEGTKAVPVLLDILRDMYVDMLALGGESPSHLSLSGDNNVWSLYDPTVYDTPSPQAEGIYLFNRRARRFIVF